MQQWDMLRFEVTFQIQLFIWTPSCSNDLQCKNTAHVDVKMFQAAHAYIDEDCDRVQKKLVSRPWVKNFRPRARMKKVSHSSLQLFSLLIYLLITFSNNQLFIQKMSENSK